MTRLVLGTRGSDLALAQARLVANQLRRLQPEAVIEERIIRTTGDERLDVSLSAPGVLDKGLFTKELEVAMRRREIDAAVHSLKDLPVEQPAGLVLGAISEREDPADVLVSKGSGGLEALPQGAIVATCSLRRKYFLLWRRPDLTIHEIRGNVPTRIQKLAESSQLSGLVLASAGLRRLKAAGVAIPFDGLHVAPLDFMLPAPGQGAIAVECRADDPATLAALAQIHHAETATRVLAERAILAGLGGGCHLPLGALAKITDGALSLQAAWFPGHGGEPRAAEHHGPIENWREAAAAVVTRLTA